MRNSLKLALAALALGAGTWAAAAEKETPPLGALDWLAADRAAWMDASKALDAPALQKWYAANGGKNTFVKACSSHLKNPSPSEFAKVYQRQACYDVASYVIEYDTAAPVAVRPVRFFHATTLITSRGILGFVETRLAESGIPVVGVEARTRDLVVEINKTLFELNSRKLRDLIHVWKEPRSPLASSPSAKIAPLKFDVEMVQLEQRTVQGILSRPSTPADAVADLNDKLKTASSLNPQMSVWTQWAAEAGAGVADFRNEVWRRALGTAIVFTFHRRSKGEYLAFMKTGALP